MHFPSDNASLCVLAKGVSLGVSLDLGQRQGILVFVTCAPYVKKCAALAIVKGYVCVLFFFNYIPVKNKADSRYFCHHWRSSIFPSAYIHKINKRNQDRQMF